MVQDVRVQPRATTRSLEATGVSDSAVSWATIFAGAFGAVATTLILLELGVGLGLSSVSVWGNVGAAASTLGIAGGIWLIVVQWISSGIGGYLAGRLRTKWVGLHTDEVFFRDTAHGFLAWALATVIGALLLALAAAAALHAGSRALGAAPLGATQLAASAIAAGNGNGNALGASGIDLGYALDTLFRPNPSNGPNPSNDGTAAAPPTNANGAAANQGDRAEAARILVRDLADGGKLSDEDRTYLAQRITARTGIGEADAEKRIDAVTAQIKNTEAQAAQAAEAARKASASAAIIAALSMLIGAFVASASAALGGRLRDAF